jgi:hypothetical protein
MGVTAIGAAATGVTPEGEDVVRGRFCDDESTRGGFPTLRPPCCGTPMYGVTSMIG